MGEEKILSPKSQSSQMLMAFKHLMSNHDAELLESPAVTNRALELGMSIDDDKDLMWIAVKSLQTNLPKGWIECKTDEGFVYFWNEETEESIWSNPVLPYYSELYRKLKAEMQQAVDNDIAEEKAAAEGDSLPPHAHPPSTPRTAAAAQAGTSASSPVTSPVQTPSHKEEGTNYEHTPGVPGLISPEPLRASRRLDMDDMGGGEKELEVEEQQEDGNYDDGKNVGDEDVDSPRDAGQLSNALVSPSPLKRKSQQYAANRLEIIEKERDALATQMRRLEDNLQASVLDAARMHDERFRFDTAVAQATSEMRRSLTTANSFLDQRGFESVHLVNANTDGGSDNDLSELAHDVDRVLRAFEKSIASDVDLDDAGYAKSFNASLSRLRSEMQDTFKNEGPVLRSGGIDTEALANKLSATADLIVSFGEYLGPEARNATYAQTLLNHIIATADADTLVPLELMSSIGFRSGMSGTGKENAWGESKSQQGDDLVKLPPPSRLASVVDELQALKAENLELRRTSTEYKQKVQVLEAKLTGSERRIEDGLLREEGLTNKFDVLMKAMEDIKMTKQFGGGDQGKSDMEVQRARKESAELRERVASLEKELLLSSKRSSEAERRLSVASEEFESQSSLFKSREVALQIQIDERKAANASLIEGREEIEAVSHELYAELQEALRAVRQVSSEKEHVKAELVKARGRGNWSVEQLSTLLETEKSRVASFETTIEELRRDLEVARVDLSASNVRVEEARMRSDEVGEALEARSHELNRARARNESLAAENDALLKRFDVKRMDVTRLTDRLANVQGNIRVFCRVRPVFKRELEAHHLTEFEVASQIHHPDSNVLEYAGSQLFEFDRVFENKATQGDVYDELEPLVSSVMDGHKACVMAYGITNAGKTFTLFEDGSGANARRAQETGTLLRAFGQIFSEAARDELVGIETDVHMSVVDIHNERICDLFHKDSADGGADVDVRVGTDGVPYVAGAIRRVVRDLAEAHTLLQLIHQHRLAGAGDDTARLDRGSLIVMVKVERYEERSRRRSTGWLYCCDLPGSQRIHEMFTAAPKLREAQHVKRSLSSLSEVIGALAGARHTHKLIPYRNSKLTFVLQSVLCPGSRVVLIANIDPLPVHARDTMDTLHFASTCREVQLGAASKTVEYGSHSSTHK